VIKLNILITDAYQETWTLKLSFDIVWLAFLPRAQEVKIAYVSPETEQFVKVSVMSVILYSKVLRQY